MIPAVTYLQWVWCELSSPLVHLLRLWCVCVIPGIHPNVPDVLRPAAALRTTCLGDTSIAKGADVSAESCLAESLKHSVFSRWSCLFFFPSGTHSTSLFGCEFDLWSVWSRAVNSSIRNVPSELHFKLLGLLYSLSQSWQYQQLAF